MKLNGDSGNARNCQPELWLEMMCEENLGKCNQLRGLIARPSRDNPALLVCKTPNWSFIRWSGPIPSLHITSEQCSKSMQRGIITPTWTSGTCKTQKSTELENLRDIVWRWSLLGTAPFTAPSALRRCPDALSYFILSWTARRWPRSKMAKTAFHTNSFWWGCVVLEEPLAAVVLQFFELFCPKTV